MGLLHRLPSDEALMSAFQNGDSNAFEVLYRRHKDKLLRFVLGLGRSSGLTRERAEELAQDSWASIIQRAESYQPQAKFTTYLFTVARNRWVDDVRKRSVRVDIDAKLEVHKDSSSELGDSFRQADAESSVEGMMDIAVDCQRLLQAIDLLSEEQRLVFLLKEEGFSLKEISVQMNQPIETTKSRLRYARARLKEHFNGRQKETVIEEGIA